MAVAAEELALLITIQRDRNQAVGTPDPIDEHMRDRGARLADTLTRLGLGLGLARRHGERADGGGKRGDGRGEIASRHESDPWCLISTACVPCKELLRQRAGGGSKQCVNLHKTFRIAA